MVRINRVYTRTGDAGQTRLAGGQVVRKSDARIEAYGSVDELNAFIGLAIEALATEAWQKRMVVQMLRIQNELFDLGAQLAVLPEDRRSNTPTITQVHIKRLEEEIDSMNRDLAPLKSFILPGGSELLARLHVARTVCRRAERALVRLAERETLDGSEIPYLNRLSDWLFVAARFAAHHSGTTERLWHPTSDQ
ncbi:MAG: cob(I)yrinic acid a,c-diamide adenosyltransferase [Calditrichaeota bacterium]|nr:MAG: cob(I)yrinic acid a,c-diamide adenosyltransferase [Calditrichota bacterium]